jgi:hypothetical protein
MGQTVQEEREETSSGEVEGETDDDPVLIRSHMLEHSSHAMPKVQPHAGFEMQDLTGGRYSPAQFSGDIATRREHYSHMSSKVKSADPDRTKFRGSHGAHMQSKVKPAEM